MDVANIPGLSITVVCDGEIFCTKAFGIRSRETDEPVGKDTIFEVAAIFESIIDSDPKSVITWARLARLYFETGRNKESLEYLQKTLKHRKFVFSIAEKLHNFHPLICWNKHITHL